MNAATALRVRELADEQLTFDQKRQLSNELTLLGRISRSSKPDAIVGEAIEKAVLRVRKEMRRDTGAPSPA